MLTIHLTILSLTILVIIFSDFNGLLWLLGRKQQLSKKLFTVLHWLVSIGLVGMILTGGYMAYGYGTEVLFKNYVFGTKMFFVAMLVINAYLIGKHMHLSFEKPFKELSRKEKQVLMISGLVSTSAWIIIFVLGKMLF